MKVWQKILLGISLSFVCLFSSMGYAQVTTQLQIFGQGQASPPNAIFIAGISNVQTSNATINTEPTNIGFPTTKVLSEVVFGGTNAWVSFDVDIVNGTPVSQYYDVLDQYPSLEGVEGSFTYEKIKETVTPGQGTRVAPGERATFKVTLQYTGTSSAQTRAMLHEFLFVLHSDDLTEAVSRGVTDQFADILNNRLEEDITYSYDGNTDTVSKKNTYDEIIAHMENVISGKYIGNLQGANADDKALLSALFEGELMFPVGNQEVPVTIMIKEKDVYGSNTKDLVLYITADDLGSRLSYVPVYAVVFSRNESGEWVQIGDIFAGEARVNGYSGSLLGTGSFNTETWRSTQRYYNQATGKDIDALMDAYVAQSN